MTENDKAATWSQSEKRSQLSRQKSGGGRPFLMLHLVNHFSFTKDAETALETRESELPLKAYFVLDPVLR